MAKITKEWIVIGNYDGSILAEMAKGILTENDIPCYIKGDFFSTAYNINALSMPGGSVKLYIPKAFKTKAEELIKDIIPSNDYIIVSSLGLLLCNIAIMKRFWLR